jgi:uncharacterized repeat protein (TIGR03806 family)
VAFALLAATLTTRGEDTATLDVEGPPPRALSAWGLFADPARQAPATGVIPFEVNTPLFTDHALKRRFYRLPPGTAATYRDPDVLEFPVGTVLVKTFANLARDPGADAAEGDPPLRLLETRLLVRRQTGWVAWPYVWDADGRDARLKLAGARLKASWTDAAGQAQAFDYLVPNANQCRGCHERGGAMVPLGPTARNLNLGEQLQAWSQAGALQGLPDAPPSLPRWDDPASGDLNARARAYLEVNCAHCHRPGGPGGTSGLDLRASQADMHLVGVHKSPVAAGRGTGGLKFAIEPGDPDASILLHRMRSTDPGVQMPELGRRLVHDEGVELIRAWIAGLKSPPGPGAAHGGGEGPNR